MAMAHWFYYAVSNRIHYWCWIGRRCFDAWATSDYETRYWLIEIFMIAGWSTAASVMVIIATLYGEQVHIK